MARKRRSPSSDPVDQVALQARALAEEKLRGSGLTLEDAAELRMHVLDREEARSLAPWVKPLAAIRFEYLSITGEPLTDWPSCPPFYRLRYLEQGTGFDELTGKPLRYVQPPDTSPVAYYPPNIDWTDVAADPSQALLITEGEFKAAKACKEGFACVGLGGVQAWRAHKRGFTWIPSLDEVEWVRRNVYVVFDSDYRTNEDVCSGLRLLAETLERKGAYPHLVSLPSVHGPDVKVGLDDFLVHAEDANDQLAQLLRLAEPLGLARPLWQLNEKFTYIADPGLIISDSGQRCTPAAFKDHLMSTEEYVARELAPDGSVKFRHVSASGAWLKWPLRRQVARLTYAPGQPRFLTADGGAYNAWPGWGCQPEAGDVQPFLDLLDHLFTGAEPAAREWFLRWCAFPLQYPGTKMFSCAVMHGRRHGTGKSLVGYTLGRIYGRNFQEIKQRDLHADFNAWAENKQFVMGDDVTGSNKREDNDLLKKLISQLSVQINVKYLPAYTVPDLINYFFTSNQPDSFFLEDDDRRHFIHEVLVGPLPEEFYQEYMLWLSTGGAEAVFDFLLHLDLGDFNPSAPAMKTRARDLMISDVQSDVGSWVRRLLIEPDRVLRVGEVPLEKDLYNNRELLLLYDPQEKTKVTANGLGRELRRAGVVQVNGGAPVRTVNGLDRFYAVRNPTRWFDATPEEVAAHIDGAEKKRKRSRY